MEQYIKEYCELLDKVILSDEADEKISAKLLEKIVSMK